MYDPVELAMIFARGTEDGRHALRAVLPQSLPSCGGPASCPGAGLIIGDRSARVDGKFLGLGLCSQIFLLKNDDIKLRAKFVVQRECRPNRIKPVYCRDCPIAKALRAAGENGDISWQSARFPVEQTIPIGHVVGFEYIENTKILWPQVRAHLDFAKQVPEEESWT